MKKLIPMLGVFFAISALMAGTVLAAQAVRVEKVVEVPGASQQDVYQRALSWSEKYGTVVSSDPNSGIIVTKSQITYPSPTVDRIQYTLMYNMRNRIAGNTSTVTFEDVMLKAPRYYTAESAGPGTPFTSTGGEITPVKSKKDVEAANKALNYVATNYADSVTGKTGTASPLLKCPECSTLAPSPEELKEHEKIHGGGHQPAEPLPEGQ